jgi:hypothetical protein
LKQPELSAYVLQEIASQDQAGGATISSIRTMVDGRQRVYLTDAEIAMALEALAARGYIMLENDRYKIAPDLRERLPRTAEGAVRMDWRTWEAFARELGIDAG